MKTVSKANQKVPSALGYRLPAEWEKHEATWLSWPHNAETWPAPAQLARVEETYIRMAEVLSHGEKVHILVAHEREEDTVRKKLSKAGAEISRVIFFRIPTVDVWMRDYGPIFLASREAKSGKPVFTRWIFNAWGNKYEPLKADKAVPGILKTLLAAEVFEPGIILEGGSIDVNGEGMLLTTEQCLLNPNRNPHLTRAQIEDYLRDYLGVSRILWLGEGIVGDDTDGHIDDIARFAAPDTVICAVEQEPSDANYPILQENRKRLEEARDQNGKKLNLIELPMPGKVECDGERLPASYANFYIGNKAVLVPIYHHANDDRALKILVECFPGRSIVGIPCEDLVCGLGAIHCVTQQQPRSEP